MKKGNTLAGSTQNEMEQQEVKESAETEAQTEEQSITEEVVTTETTSVEQPETEAKAVAKLSYIANNDTFVFECQEGIEKVSGTFNGEKASGVVIDGIAHMKLSKPLPEEYTYTID